MCEHEHLACRWGNLSSDTCCTWPLRVQHLTFELFRGQNSHSLSVKSKCEHCYYGPLSYLQIFDYDVSLWAWDSTENICESHHPEFLLWQCIWSWTQKNLCTLLSANSRSTMHVSMSNQWITSPWIEKAKVLCKITHCAAHNTRPRTNLDVKLLVDQDSWVSCMFSVGKSVTLVHC